MESALERKNALEKWLRADCHVPFNAMQTMQHDASFRRYFRIHSPLGTFVAMDAPPLHETSKPYVAIANALRTLGLHTPEIIYADLQQGFLLITDFGDLTFLKALTVHNADLLYRHALASLAVLQTCQTVAHYSIPVFTSEWMWQEWAWHKEWFLGKLLQVEFNAEEAALDQCYAQLVAVAVKQPQLFMHRDYHSANLMLMPSTPMKMGILDFQDAFVGPLTYDLVSLLRDCYIDWPDAQVTNWALAYRQQLLERGMLQHVEQSEFLRWFDWMGMQRHLKALFTFARKHVRDQQSHYLHHVPRTLGYLLNISQRYPELTMLHRYLHTHVQPAFARVQSTLCVH